MATMLLGLAAVVGAVWLSSPSLALFIVGGAVSIAGAGTVFRGAIAVVITISPPERRAEIVAAAYVAVLSGFSLPIIGAGIALTEGVSPRVTLLGLAILVAAGIVLSAIKLLRGAHRERGPISPGSPVASGTAGSGRGKPQRPQLPATRQSESWGRVVKEPPPRGLETTGGTIT
jgi:MFS family permease